MIYVYTNNINNVHMFAVTWLFDKTHLDLQCLSEYNCDKTLRKDYKRDKLFCFQIKNSYLCFSMSWFEGYRIIRKDHRSNFKQVNNVCRECSGSHMGNPGLLISQYIWELW
jgi:hypothetical protein